MNDVLKGLYASAIVGDVPQIKPHIGAAATQGVDIGFCGDIADSCDGRVSVGIELLAQAARDHAVEQAAALAADTDGPDLRLHAFSYTLCGYGAAWRPFMRVRDGEGRLWVRRKMSRMHDATDLPKSFGFAGRPDNPAL